MSHLSEYQQLYEEILENHNKIQDKHCNCLLEYKQKKQKEFVYKYKLKQRIIGRTPGPASYKIQSIDFPEHKEYFNRHESTFNRATRGFGLGPAFTDFKKRE